MFPTIRSSKGVITSSLFSRSVYCQARPISHSYQLIPRTGSSSSCRVSRAGSLDRASSSADRREPAGVEIATATEHREAPVHRADLRLLVRDDFLGELPH